MEKILELKIFQCQRCYAYNQTGLCKCGYPFYNIVNKSQKEYCNLFGHVGFSPHVKTIQDAYIYVEVCKCLGCGEEFKRDPRNPPSESIGCGNCKKESDRPEDWHDDCVKY